MPIEIERKFLVSGEYPRTGGMRTSQAYLCTDPARTVRVRIEPERALLAIKGEPVGLARPEFEYEIPMDEARELMKLCAGSVVEKTRYHHREGGHLWEIDVFHGANDGLVIAEIELEAEHEAFDRPDWLGEEVSEDPRYFNSYLSISPYSQW
jgi:adenylate cyclase